jgi:hypothetical protein
MPEPDAPVAPTPTLTRDVPLSQQTNKILALMNAMPEDKPAEKPVEKVVDKPDEKVADKPTEPVEGTPEEPVTPTFLSEDTEDDEEQPEVKPFNETLENYVSAAVKPIKVVGLQAGEPKEFTVYTQRDLPADFEYRNTREAALYAEEFVNLRLRAEAKQLEYNQKVNQEQVRVFEVQQAKDIASDLKWLQSRGVVPQFEYEESDPRFNSDPAVKEANAIYELYTKTNNQYAQKYMGSNRSYRISYRDAADKYYASQARQTKVAPVADKELKPEKTAIQKQRDNISGKAGAPQGGDAQVAKPKAFQGMSFSDINRLARAGKI